MISMVSLGLVTSLLLLWLEPRDAATARIAVPDLAGMLYPQHAQQVARFGIAPPATTEPLFATRWLGEDKPRQCDASAFCVETVWTSDFAVDPFELMAFESEFPVASTTFDGITIANVWPQVEGTDDGNRDAGRRLQTLWRFHVLQSVPGPTFNSRNQTIDLVFRLRQQSQRGAVRDQVIVHGSAAFGAGLPPVADVDAYVLYGNVRLESKVTQRAENQIEVSIDIARKPGSADVTTQDAFPLTPRDRDESAVWQLVDDKCLEATSYLLGCAAPADLNAGACSFDTSTAALPSCLRSRFGESIDRFRSMSATDSRSIRSWGVCLNELLTYDTDMGLNPMQRRWWNATRALNALAVYSCPFGLLEGLPGNATTDPRMLVLTDVTAFTFNLRWAIQDGFYGYFRLVLGGQVNSGDAVFTSATNLVSSNSTADAIQATILAAFSGFDTVSVHVYKDDSTGSLSIDISKFFFPGMALEYHDLQDSPPPDYTSYDSLGGSASMRTVPLNSSQLTRVEACVLCTSELAACRANQACYQTVLPCFTSQLQQLRVDEAELEPVYGTYRVHFMERIETACLDSVDKSAWDPLRRLLICMSNSHCRTNSGNTTSADEVTTIGHRNGSQLIVVPPDPTDPSRILVIVNVRNRTSVVNTTISGLATAFEQIVFESAASVTVEHQWLASDPSMLQVRLWYKDWFGFNPSFNTADGLMVLEETPASWFLECGDPTTFSTETLSQMLQASARELIVSSAPNHSWALAPRCLECSSNFFDCSTDEVDTRSCGYDNAVGPLVRCIRQALPRTSYAAMFTPHLDPEDAGYSDSGDGEILTITHELMACMQSTMNNTMANRIAMSAALSCFSRSHCPFGPLDLVRSNGMVTLKTSPYVQTFRIPRRHFQIQLYFALGNHAIGNAKLTDDILSSYGVSEVLQPLGITVEYGKNEWSESSFEWTIRLRYHHVVAVDFSVRVGDESVPHPSLISRAIIQPSVRLIVTPIAPDSIYSLKTTNGTTFPPHTGSGSSSTEDGASSNDTSSSSSRSSSYSYDRDSHDSGSHAAATPHPTGGATGSSSGPSNWTWPSVSGSSSDSHDSGSQGTATPPPTSSATGSSSGPSEPTGSGASGPSLDSSDSGSHATVTPHPTGSATGSSSGPGMSGSASDVHDSDSHSGGSEVTVTPRPTASSTGSSSNPSDSSESAVSGTSSDSHGSDSQGPRTPRPTSGPSDSAGSDVSGSSSRA